MGLTSLQLKIQLDFSSALCVPLFPECFSGSCVASSINSAFLGTCFSYPIKDAVQYLWTVQGNRLNATALYFPELEVRQMCPNWHLQ